MAQAYLEQGAISADEAEISPFRNILWNVVAGDSKTLWPTVYRLSLSHGDQLLLCTDRLITHIAEAEIREVLESPLATEAQCKLLIDAANDRGGRDNITVVVARMLSAETANDVLTAGQGIDALDETVVEA